MRISDWSSDVCSSDLGRLLVDDAAAYRASTQRVIDFLGDRTVTHVLGGHVEMKVDDELYPHGSQHHPNERRLQMTRADLLAMPAAFADFNGFHGRYEQFVITNPIHMLWALAITALAVVSLLAWGVVRVLRRRSPKR